MMKLSSLQSRVVMLAAGTATLAVLISVYLFDRSTRLEFHTFLNAREPSAAAVAIPARLEEWRRSAGSWNGVRETLEDPDGDHLRIELGRGGPRGAASLIDVRGAGTPLRDAAGAEAGRVYVLPPFRTRGDRRQRFLVSMRRSLLLAAVLAILSAIILSLLPTRALLRPVRKLTEVARALERGDWSQHVSIHSRDEIGELGSAFNSLAGTLARNEQLRRDLVDDVVHELRTPFTNIRCHLEAMLDGLAEPNHDTLASLHEETLLLNHLIDDLRDLSLAEAGQLNLSLEPCAIRPELERVVVYTPAAAAKGIGITLEAPFDGVEVYADPARLAQILRNLLSNAIRHTQSAGRITVRARGEKSGVAIEVEDNGSGIAAEHLPHIFERFYRADRSRRRQSGGAGLGLSIVKRLTEAHGGAVTVASKPGEGTRFTVHLKRAGC
jgi:signal transduction histidine kinase